MSITFVGAQGNAGTTVTIPTHQSGDLILLFAYRDGSNTAPSTPAAGGTVPTWTLIGSDGANTNSTNFRYAVATASTTTSGTWTNATEIICLVYRGTSLPGASAGGGANNSNSIAYPALTLNRTDGTSWVVGVAGHRTATNVEVAPTGMTNRASTGTEAAGHDTNGAVSSWSQQTVTVNASSGWRSWTVELRDNSLSVIGAAGSFNETGQAATLKIGRKVISDVGTFNESGQAATLTTTRKLASNAGSFSEDGKAALLEYGRVFSANVGSYALTGQDVTLAKRVNYTLTSDAGTYALTGQPANSKQTFSLAANAGSFTVNGQSAGFQGQKYLVAGATSFAVTGQAADVKAQKSLSAQAGSFTQSGQSVNLYYGRRFAAAADNYALTGYAAGFAYNRNLTGAAATFVFTGNPATLLRTAADTVLQADARAFNAIGQSAALKQGLVVFSNVAAFTATGQTARTVKRRRQLIQF